LVVDDAIEAEGLIKTYPNGVKALDGLSFAVQPGSVFALLGPNGAGKSTAVKVLTTLARADAGRATVAGIDVAAAPDLPLVPAVGLIGAACGGVRGVIRSRPDGVARPHGRRAKRGP
jgi:ABC-type Na+ transport system ATPase subunit NatA